MPKPSTTEPACPSCGTTMSEIVWGYPEPPVPADKVVGGCIVTGDDPSHSCRACGTQRWPDGRTAPAGDHDPFRGW